MFLWHGVRLVILGIINFVLGRYLKKFRRRSEGASPTVNPPITTFSEAVEDLLAQEGEWSVTVPREDVEDFEHERRARMGKSHVTHVTTQQPPKTAMDVALQVIHDFRPQGFNIYEIARPVSTTEGYAYVHALAKTLAQGVLDPQKKPQADRCLEELKKLEKGTWVGKASHHLLYKNFPFDQLLERLDQAVRDWHANQRSTERAAIHHQQSRKKTDRGGGSLGL